MSAEGEERKEEETVPLPLPIRLVGPAREDIRAAHQRFTELSGIRIADEWEDSLYAKLKQLGQRATGYAVVPLETRLLKMEIRAFSFQRRPGSVAYRVLYTIVRDEMHGLAAQGDPPFVLILHIRHASRRPVRAKEATELLQALEDAESAG